MNDIAGQEETAKIFNKTINQPVTSTKGEWVQIDPIEEDKGKNSSEA